MTLFGNTVPNCSPDKTHIPASECSSSAKNPRRQGRVLCATFELPIRSILHGVSRRTLYLPVLKSSQHWPSRTTQITPKSVSMEAARSYEWLNRMEFPAVLGN